MDVAVEIPIWSGPRSIRSTRAIHHEHLSPMRVFHGSIAYFTLLFVAVAVDALLPF